MKELSIEEKAKRYDEALEKGKQIQNTPYTAHWDIMKEVAEHLLPELKECEDEKIRKRIIQALHGDVLEMSEIKEAVDWLENQGKHSNFLSKIQVGDKVTHNEDGVLVNLSQLKRVAKPAEEQGEQKPVVIPKFRIGDIIKDTEDGEVFIIRTITKDKYIYTDDSFDWIKGQDKYELVGQKPWSEEDEKILNGVIINYKSGYLPSVEKRDKIIEKLESLKGRVQPQNTWKPSDEQMNTLEYYMHTLVCNEHKEILFGLYSCLKKLREE